MRFLPILKLLETFVEGYSRGSARGTSHAEFRLPYGPCRMNVLSRWIPLRFELLISVACPTEK